MPNDLAAAILASSQHLGIRPVDLATAISYETGGTFDPWKAGPTTQYGQHRGLIQWGEPQRARYGVTQGMPVGDQMHAVESYLTDAGVRPGMGLMDVYSAINAGHVGRYGASDANNGGAPGTVADKVNTQMDGHRQKAEALLGGMFDPGGAGATPQPAGGPPVIAAPWQPGSVVPVAVAAPAVDPIASMFAQQNQTAEADRQARAANDQARKHALLSNVGAMFG